MKQALLFLPLLVFTAADTWQPFAIDSHVTVQLPGQPTETDLAKLNTGKNLGHTQMWTLKAADGIYMVMRLPNKGSIGRADTAGRQAYYAGVLTSVMRNEKAQTLSLTDFPTSVGEGIEYKYKAIHRGTGKRVIKYVRYLVVDSIGYSLAFTPADKLDSTGTAGNVQRRRFFDSITVKP